MGVLSDKRSNTAKHKITLRLPEELYATAQEAVSLGLASSQVAFIEDSIRQRAREVRHMRLRKLAEEAMADAGFVSDMHSTMQAFQVVDKWDVTAADFRNTGTLLRY